MQLRGVHLSEVQVIPEFCLSFCDCVGHYQELIVATKSFVGCILAFSGTLNFKFKYAWNIKVEQ